MESGSAVEAAVATTIRPSGRSAAADAVSGDRRTRDAIPL